VPPFVCTSPWGFSGKFSYCNLIALSLSRQFSDYKLKSSNKFKNREQNSNITVNCICPGLVNTDMVKDINPVVLDKIINALPVKKIIEPDEIFKICEFIINSEYSTGSVFSVDCGMNC
jgi:NAD(P)-dependent dehydrogenase (short-subunit alcohol dehydrogenase family)